jgi:hypothetical protein
VFPIWAKCEMRVGNIRPRIQTAYMCCPHTSSVKKTCPKTYTSSSKLNQVLIDHTLVNGPVGCEPVAYRVDN